MSYQEFIEEWRNDCEFIECHTSGSTGTPKRILLPKVQMAASARRTLEFFQIHSGAHFYSCIAPDFIGGKMQAVRSEISNGSLSWETPSNRPEELCKTSKKIDLLSVVPSQMHWLLDNVDSLPDIGVILIGGSPIPDSLRERIGKSGLNAWETYGMTETASHIALRRVTQEVDSFTPLSGISISIEQDNNDNEIAVDGEKLIGCLAIDIDGWQRIVTNDLAEINPDGTFHILGRKDNMIITGGKKVSPEEMEHRLAHTLQWPVMISWEPDPLWGQKIVAIVESPEEMDEAAKQKVIREWHNLLPGYMVPKEIICTPIPRTANGKFMRRKSDDAHSPQK